MYYMLMNIHVSKYMCVTRQTYTRDPFKLPAQLLQGLAALLAITFVACSHQVGPLPEAAFGDRLDMIHCQV